VLRARDFQRKQGTLKQLRHKAAMRNPDEFYFAMQSSKTKGARACMCMCMCG
jgi:U3 small nucleolar RNA-associated protein 11